MQKAQQQHKIETVTITPERATELLEHNQLNRPLSDRHVRRIASQIIEGKWKFNGDTIKIAQGGEVIDGQHRLWAIIEAKKPVETIVVYGLSRDAFATVDTIRRLRSGGDVVALAGVSRHRNTVAIALTWFLRWQAGTLETYRDPQNKIENSDIEKAYLAHPGIIRAAERVTSLRSLVNTSILAFVYYILANQNPELGERLVDTLVNPGGSSINDPLYRLRVQLAGSAYKRREPLTCIAIMIKALNAAYRGEQVKTLSWRNQGTAPEKFPVLDVGKKPAK